MKYSLLIFIGCCLINFSQAQNNEKLSQLASENHYPIRYHQGKFSGKGWNLVLQAAQQHKYFLIGEDHGLAEVPRFALALSQKIPYDVFVTEIDSITAEVMQRLVRQKPVTIQRFHHQQPAALSFYSAVEEFALVQQLAQQATTFWGLDQVSLFSTGLVLQQLAKQASSEKAKKLALKLAKTSDQLFETAVKTGNYDTLWIFSENKKVFQQLEKTFEKEHPKARQIVRDLLASWHIYSGNKHANRVATMKQKLLNYYFVQRQKRATAKKVLFKFGANHVARGKSLFAGYDIGNLVANLAHAEKQKTYHVMIVGKAGTMNTFLPTKGMTTQKFDIAHKKHTLKVLKPFFTQLKGADWGLFDLRPIKKALAKQKVWIKNRLLARIIEGYDALVIIPEVSASHLMK